MKINLINPDAMLYQDQSYTVVLEKLERAGRLCYKSRAKDGSREASERFLKSRIDQHHESVIEHAAISVEIICDRAVSHQLVRHRLASYSQESMRYCNYKDEMTFIIPEWCPLEQTSFDLDVNNYNVIAKGDEKARQWVYAIASSASHYRLLTELGARPEQARLVLPMSIKTELIMTANPREWRHIFKERTSSAADPEMRRLMIPLLNDFKRIFPCLFEDIDVY